MNFRSILDAGSPTPSGILCSSYRIETGKRWHMRVKAVESPSLNFPKTWAPSSNHDLLFPRGPRQARLQQCVRALPGRVPHSLQRLSRYNEALSARAGGSVGATSVVGCACPVLVTFPRCSETDESDQQFSITPAITLQYGTYLLNSREKR